MSKRQYFSVARDDNQVSFYLWELYQGVEKPEAILVKIVDLLNILY